MKTSMGKCTNSLFFLLGWNILSCDATVTVSLINSANGMETLECRSDGIVSCSINPYTNLINWAIDGTPYVTCTSGCIVNPSITRTYSPTYDFTNGIFNLTVDSATLNDNSTTFKCDDGLLSDEITIEVVPAYSENKTSINGTQVGCTTACVQLGVEFEWFTVKTDNSDRKTYNEGQNEMTETAECSLDLDCGGVGTGKVSSVITVPKVSKGEERYIEVDVKYKNPYEERTFRFDQKFKFEVPDCPFHCGWIIGLIYGLISIFLLIVFSVGYYCNTKFQKYIEESDLGCWFFVPLIGIICTAYLLYDNQREHYSWKSCSVFIVCCSLDIGILIVMILTCTDIIEVGCYIYGVYAIFGLILSKMYIFCLAECLQKGNNKTGDKPEHQTGPIDDVFKKRKHEDMSDHEDMAKIEKKSKTWTCYSCKQPQQTELKLENQCIHCKEYLCKKCTLEHLKPHSSIKTTHMQKHKPIRLKYIVSQASVDTNRITDNCLCSNIRNESQLYCLSCQLYVCTHCFTKHAGHSILRHQHEEKRYKGNFECSGGRNNAESYCLACQQYLCKWCITNHAGHRIIRHCQQEAGEKQCQIFCDLCEKETEAKYYSKGKKWFVCEDCKSVEGPKDIIAVDDLFFHSENNIESYCLSCQQYLCSLCFTKHAEHRILRHSQQETKLDESHRSNLSKGTGYKPDRRDRNTLGVSLAFEIPRVKYTKAVAGNARCHILCKYCQNLSIKADAKYYSKIDNSFFCEDGKPEIGLEDIIAVDGHGWKCRCSINPVECEEMDYKEKLCAACFEHTVIEEGIRHRKMCALHSGLSVKNNDVTELPADVLCLVCNEYLCKMCFKQHLHLKQLWLLQHPDEEKLKQQASRITSILQENRLEDEEDFNLVRPFDDQNDVNGQILNSRM